MQKTMIDTVGLSKSFGVTLAVDALDWRVKARSIAGIVGPNGAGKGTVTGTKGVGHKIVDLPGQHGRVLAQVARNTLVI